MIVLGDVNFWRSDSKGFRYVSVLTCITPRYDGSAHEAYFDLQ